MEQLVITPEGITVNGQGPVVPLPEDVKKQISETFNDDYSSLKLVSGETSSEEKIVLADSFKRILANKFYGGYFSGTPTMGFTPDVIIRQKE